MESKLSRTQWSKTPYAGSTAKHTEASFGALMSKYQIVNRRSAPTNFCANSISLYRNEAACAPATSFSRKRRGRGR